MSGARVPVGVVALLGDAVHPVPVARTWHASLPRGALRIIGLDAFGADPAALGRAAVDGWERARRD